MGTHDSSPPPGVAPPRRRMVLRKIGQTTPLPSSASSASPAGAGSPLADVASAREARATASSAPLAPAPRSVQPRPSVVSTPSTILPPSATDDAAAPIPLTRLHTPRPRFRSAMDLSPLPGGGGDESPVHETSTSTLPPLVASLPPVSPPIYVPAPSRSARSGAHAGPMMVLGSAAAIAALAILGGVAVGRRISVPARAAGSELAPPVAIEAPVPSPPPVASLAAPPPAAPPAALAAPEQPAAIAVDGVTPVENLPKATVQPEVKVAPAYARPAERPVASPPAPAAAPAVAAAPKAESHVQARAAIEAAGHDGAKDPVSPDEGASPPEGAEGKKATEPKEPDVDPLVKAVRDDIQEEEAARKKQSR